MNIQKTIAEHWFLIVLTIASILAVLPFFTPGFFPIHDDTQVQRVFEMKTALSDGMFPVRWVPDLGYGYGYPIFNFYAPLPYYIGGFLALFGIDALFATKLMISVVIIGSAFSMYLLAKQFWGKFGGLLSGVLYLFAPYHALNTYVRGDIGELYAYFFIPLIFYGIWRYYKTPEYKYLLTGSLTYAGLITSHNLSAMMVTPFVSLFILVLLFKKRKFRILIIPVLGILLSSFYFIPALLEMDYTNVTKVVDVGMNYKSHFVCIPQIWDSLWMYGGSTTGCIDGLSFKLGKIHLILSVISLLFAILYFKKEKLLSSLLLLTFLSLLFSLFLMTDLSQFIWSVVPFMNYFQFPWRFLLVASFFSSFIGGAVLYFIPKLLPGKLERSIVFTSGVLLIVITIVFNLKIFEPQMHIYKTANEYTNKEFINWTTSRVSDEYLPKSFKAPSTKEEIFTQRINGENVRVYNVFEKTNLISAELKTATKSSVIVHNSYFPAWNYYLNDKKIQVKEVDRGVSLEIPPGDHKLVVKFEQTPIEKFANLLSLAGIIAIIVGIIYAKRKDHE